MIKVGSLVTLNNSFTDKYNRIRTDVKFNIANPWDVYVVEGIEELSRIAHLVGSPKEFKQIHVENLRLATPLEIIKTRLEHDC